MPYVFFYFQNTDNEAQEIIKSRREFLAEGSRTYSLKGGYSVRCDTNNPPPTQDHLHIMKRGNDIVCMNKDGSVHDGMSGAIPKKIFTDLQNLFPGYSFNKNRIVECTEPKWLRIIESIKTAEIPFDDLIDETMNIIIQNS